MKRWLSWQMMFAASLVMASIFFYLLHYYIFRDAHHIFVYLIGDIAFLFLDVLIVMLVLHRVLEQREKQAIMKKLNMVIGTFFSEVGTDLLKICAAFDPESCALGQHLVITGTWSNREFAQAAQAVKKCLFPMNIKRGDVDALRKFLIGKRSFLLSLLENPNLLEHESFSDLLWAVFHMTDELAHRKDLHVLPEADYAHLDGDVKRVYQQLIVQWLEYMRHLKRDYPYLFSLAMRTNPFDQNASVEVSR